jgi:tRNA-modifying protein YgfZ
VAISPAQIELDAQYRQLREGAGLLDRSERGMLAVLGTEGPEYLQGQLTNEIEGLAVGEGVYAALLDRKGHVKADMRVLRLAPEETWIDTEPTALEAVLSHLRTYSVGREVEIAVRSGERALLSLIGPGSGSVAGVRPGPEHSSREVEIGGVSSLAISAADGIDFLVDPADVEALRTALLEAGAEGVTAEAAEILRIEQGRPRFGAEITSATMPAEAGIVERAVNFEKGCYIGQEPVARLHYKGRPNRHLRGLRLEGALQAGTPLRLGERELGTIGSSCLHPVLGPIALAVLRREAEPGATVIAADGTPAEVVELPFVAGR